eukprot:CAMPEP_0197726804 /NCGR_PEP_ID=MMETSP1434-20131217/17192_1 /TAXON_ID=265543 /ORGANISM="Minutocellus polymorphus, Strain CCMP3303" /LENGTH=395 /DNA_ID=CAMNT_0043312831 /DNA_START=22 /DNA_END=1209 /DNA_ORIENTATION=-
MATLSGITGAVPSVGRSAAASAATQSMAELGIASIIGAGCVEREMLTRPTIKALSKATFSILLPMFLCTSIIQSVAKYGLKRSSLAVPMLAIVQSTCLLLASKLILLPLAGIDVESDDGRATTICCSFGNSGVVPLIFCESLFRQSANSDYVAQSTAFVSLFLIGWSPYFWSFGRSVLMPDRSNSSETKSNATKLMDLAKRALPPPVVGVFVGLFIATTPLCRLFLSPSDCEAKAPLSIMFNSVANFGRAASPLSLLILVSSLAIGAGIGKHNTSEDASKQIERGGEGAEANLLTKWAVVSIMRFLFSPALMYGLLHLAELIGAIGGIDDNPMLWFVLILEATMPPAQNSVTMLQVADRGDDAASLAMFLFSVYLTSMVPVVIVLTLALQKFKLA